MTDSERMMQLERENNKLRTIHALQRQIWAMQQEEDMQALWTTLHDHLSCLIEFDGCSVSLIDEERGEVRCYNLSEQNVEFQREVPLSDILPVQVWRSQKAFYRKDLDPDEPGDSAYFSWEGTDAHVRSVLGVPFSKGTIAINSVHPDAFSHADIGLLEELAQAISECFARVEALRELEQRRIANKWAKEDLRKYHDELQIEVQKRTEELSKTIKALNEQIVDQVLAAEAVVESEERYRTLFEDAPDAIFLFDPESGEILDTNPAASQLLLRPYEKIVGLHQSQLHPPRMEKYSKEVFTRHIQQIQQAEHARAIENVVLRPDGSETPVEILVQTVHIQGKPILQGVFRDITERVRMEEALRISAQQWRTTFDAMSDAVFLVDLERRIVRCNKTMTELLGKSFSEITHCTCSELIHGTSEPIEGCPFVHMQETRRREVTILPMDDRWFNHIVDPLLDNAGNLIGAIHIMSDITERVQMEQQLIQTERLRALGEMAAGIAHNFNNILVGVLGYAELIPYEVDNPETVIAYARTIVESAQKAAQVIQNIQGFTRMKPGEGYDWMDLKEIVEQSMLLSRLKWKDEPGKHGHRVTMETVFGEIPRIKGNAGEFSDVVVNLIFNAVEAMPSGGTITIRTEQQDGYVHLVVSDTGIGMDEETKKRIFEPLYTTKGYEIGRGLGLSSVYATVQRHGGHIEVESTLYQGTTFTIALPIPREGREKRGEEKEVVSISSRRILLVDDEEIVRKVIHLMLEQAGHTVEVAPDGSEALKRFQKRTYDLVITDLGMSGLSGDTLADRVRGLAPTVPVVALTGWELDEEQRRHFDEVLKKPVRQEALERVLTKCLGG